VNLAKYQNSLLQYINTLDLNKEPNNLYQPIDYILNLEGKRIRPVLTLLAANTFSKEYKKALPAALAIEVFHNFTLVHDDIMDDAPLRRGKQTVHEKWNLNTGILSGDAMLIASYQLFEGYDANTFKELVTLFSKTAMEVCEGQQFDIDFETRSDVTISEYIEMIRLKTSVLLAAALKTGSIIGGASDEDAKEMYQFGIHLGIAFQLQDDLLDTFGDPKTFGKQVGGDIIENKKTYLYLKALELASSKQKNLLEDFYKTKLLDNKKKITEVKNIFRETRVVEETEKLIHSYYQKSLHNIESLHADSEKKLFLQEFAKNIMARKK